MDLKVLPEPSKAKCSRKGPWIRIQAGRRACETHWGIPVVTFQLRALTKPCRFRDLLVFRPIALFFKADAGMVVAQPRFRSCMPLFVKIPKPVV